MAEEERQAIIAVGANIGDRWGTIQLALRHLGDTPDVSGVTASRIYETDPVGVTDQPAFLNLVVGISTSLRPLPLLHRLLEIEQTLGRVRETRWGPRTIDLDLLFYEGETCALPELTLPHPRWRERPFVIVPLQDLLLNSPWPRPAWRSLHEEVRHHPATPSVREWQLGG